jgi:hypothetical protein
MTRARDFADLAGSADAGGITGKNVVINGACNVAQRGTSSTGLGGSAPGYTTVDRWQLSIGSTSAGRFTAAQVAVTDLPGFANAFHLDCTTADTSIAAGELLKIDYKIEGQDLQRFKKGTSSAEPITISFYMKTNKAFTFMCELDDRDNNRINSNQFTTSTSWTRHEITIPGDTTGTLDDDNNVSFVISLWFHAGSTYTGGTYSANTWQSRASSDNMRAVGIGSFFDSTDNDIKITGLQMELGQKATPFEHENVETTLRKCQRYYFKFLEGNTKEIGVAWYFTSTHSSFMFRFPTTMRATPTGTATSGTDYYTIFRNGVSDAFNSITFENGSTEQFSAFNNSELTGPATAAGLVRSTNASAKVEFSAEL